MTRLPWRIIHVASGREWRGGQRQVLLLAAALAARRDAPDQVVVTGQDTPLARRLAEAGVSVAAVGWRAGLSPAAQAGVLREIARGPALLHAHDAHAVTIAGLAAMLTRSPFIATRRAVFPLHRAGFWTRADCIIAISDAVRSTLVAGGVDPARIARVYSGIDVEAVRRVRPGRIREELGLRNGAALAVSVGALGRDKDHDTLLTAAAALRTRRPELHWAIAGEGPLRAALESRIAELGLGDRVRLMGALDDPLALVAAADVFVMSSRDEGLGTSVLDAMALDVPIAATRTGGIPEMIREDAGLLSPPRDGPALADSVDRLLGDSSLRSEVVRAAHQRVERFSAHEMAEGVLTVYRSVAEAVARK